MCPRGLAHYPHAGNCPAEEAIDANKRTVKSAAAARFLGRRRRSARARQTSSAQRTYRVFGVKPAFSKTPNAPKGFAESTLKLARP
jgi:hypothetical protein